MRNEYLKTLWMLRFKKMKKTEEEAASGYQEILGYCLADLGKNDKLVVLLEQLVREERSHARLAEELVRICGENHPDVVSLDQEYELEGQTECG